MMRFIGLLLCLCSRRCRAVRRPLAGWFDGDSERNGGAKTAEQQYAYFHPDGTRYALVVGKQQQYLLSAGEKESGV